MTFEKEGTSTPSMDPAERKRSSLDNSMNSDKGSGISTLKSKDTCENEESPEKTYKYPKSVIFIVSNEFCERFTFYGIRTILAIYLSSILNFSKSDATVIYHAFVLLCYFTPLFGAMLADSLLGRFRTIFYVSIVYVLGNLVLSIGTIPDLRSGAVSATVIGLLLIAAGTGGIKPCVSSFGGDQFVLPQQEKQQKQFFSVFYFAINSGSLISTFLTPVLRQDVKCFGEDSCYMVAFGVPAIFMIVSLSIFLLGKPMYRISKPEGNLMLQLCKLMKHAVVEKFKNKGPKKEHWLDYGSDKFQQSFIDDVKSAFKVLALFVPLPVFWALFDQQGSRWTFQAQQMNGVMGSFTLQPDQMQVVNPLLILAFIPLFESCIYPLLAKCNLMTKSIPRIFIGGCLAALAFLISGILDLQLEPSLAVVPSAGEGQLRIFNGGNTNCSFNLTLPLDQESFSGNIRAMDHWTMQHIKVKGNNTHANIHVNCEDQNTLDQEILLMEEEALSYLIRKDGDSFSLEGGYFDSVEKSPNGYSKVRILYSHEVNSFTFKNDDGSTTLKATGTHGTAYVSLEPGDYHLFVDNESLEKISLFQGGVYTVLVSANNEVQLAEITSKNDVHMMWQIPQYAIITAGEIMFSITGLEFAFTQAPASMKSVVSACWLLTDSFGNLIVIIIESARIFDKQAYEYFLFAGIMVVVMFIFLWMAWNFKYKAVQQEEDDLEDAVVNGNM